MIFSAQEYAQNAQSLCVLPDVYLRLKEIMDDESSSLQDIADIIQLEPALSSTLLKLANSAMFNFPREVDSIARALTLLGMNETRNLVDTYGATCAFSVLDNSVIDIDKFWEISVDCALICKYLAKTMNIKGEGLFVSGLLYNIGELVVMYSNVEQVLQCQDFDKKETPWHKQLKTFGFTYDKCTVELLNLWQLPESLINPISQLEHALDDKNDNISAKLLYVASRLAILNYHPGLYDKNAFIPRSLLLALGLDWDDLNNAINYCNAEGLVILSALKLKH